MAQEESKELSNKILVQKGTNLSRNQEIRTRKRRCTSSSSQSRSPPRQRKKRSKKPSEKKRRRRSPSSSSSSSSSHSSSSESEEEDQETKRFHIVSNEDQFKWDLPPELGSYANTQFEKYIAEKCIHEAICEVHLVSNNFNQVKKIDEILRDLLKEKNKTNSLAINEILGKIQKRTLSVMGPLSKVWLKLENTRNSDAPPLSLDEIQVFQNKPFVYLLKQVIRFCTIESTTFYRARALLRRQKTR